MNKNYNLIFVLIIVLISCSDNNELFVPFSNTEIEYWGRIDSTRVEGIQLIWSGTSIKINFEGESIQALMKDESGDNYYNVIIDNDFTSIIKPDTVRQYYDLGSNLSKGKHSIEIFKRTEWDRGITNFYGFNISNNAKLLSKSPSKKKKMEFYGNSITAGYAIEDFTGKDSPDSTYTNNYLSYAAITSRHFDAKYQCICKSGIGITVSWHPLIMPEMYNRLIPTDSNSEWNFSLYQPDIVVINLFQNDSWLVNLPEHEEFKKRFGTKAPDDEFIINTYQQFVVDLRQEYPNANIICSLGSMDAAKKGSKWMEYINIAVENINDKKVFTHFMPYMEATAHPSIKDHQIMANSLIEFIDDNID
jgi:hypothetical protein